MAAGLAGTGGISVLACDGRCGGTRVRRPAIARAPAMPPHGVLMFLGTVALIAEQRLGMRRPRRCER